MKTVGIIAEYNPFHNGHQFHMEEAKRQTGADYVVVVMSGSFVQRGAPSVLNKYDRARMALLHGADLVFELPLIAALSSAEGFATGAVSLLAGLGATDCISCGCESADKDPELFVEVCGLLCDEPPAYRQSLQSGLRGGMTYPAAREAALRSCMDEARDPAGLLSGPNNILALEYARAIRSLGSPMDLCLIRRRGSSSHSDTILCPSEDGPAEVFSSAAAIRNALFVDTESSVLRQSLPADVYDNLMEQKARRCLLREDDFSDLLSYALTKNRGILREFGPENSDIADRAAKLAECFSGWRAFAEQIKTKNLTYTAVSRFLAQVLLDLRREDYACAAQYRYAPYARLLGFRKDAAPLMKSIQSNAALPVITQPAKDRSSLSATQRHLFDLDLAASEIYRLILRSRSGYELKPELRQPLLVIS